MAKHKINPETLKTLRDKVKLSQQGLADVSGVSKKTIARIETGTGNSSANTTTVTRLAKALNIRPEQLSKSADSSDSLDFFVDGGWRKVNLPLPANMLLALQMVEKCYGISQATQLRMLPLFTALLMEGSLAWRKQKVEEAEEACNKFEEAFDKYHPGIDVLTDKIKECLMGEKYLIEERDFFGEYDPLDEYFHLMDFINEENAHIYSVYSKGDKEFCGRFQQYLKYLVEKLDSDLIRIQGKPSYSQNTFEVTSLGLELDWINYTINSSELDFITDGNELACKALQWGYATIKDIPQELIKKEKTAERIDWLTNKIPQKRRDDYKKYWDDLRNKLGPINL